MEGKACALFTIKAPHQITEQKNTHLLSAVPFYPSFQFTEHGLKAPLSQTPGTSNHSWPRRKPTGSQAYGHAPSSCRSCIQRQRTKISIATLFELFQAREGTGFELPVEQVKEQVPLAGRCKEGFSGQVTGLFSIHFHSPPQGYNQGKD